MRWRGKKGSSEKCVLRGEKTQVVELQQDVVTPRSPSPSRRSYACWTAPMARVNGAARLPEPEQRNRRFDCFPDLNTHFSEEPKKGAALRWSTDCERAVLQHIWPELSSSARGSCAVFGPILCYPSSSWRCCGEHDNIRPRAELLRIDGYARIAGPAHRVGFSCVFRFCQPTRDLCFFTGSRLFPRLKHRLDHPLKLQESLTFLDVSGAATLGPSW